MDKYVMFVPVGGFNDILTGILNSIDYCKQYNRTLLIPMKWSCYSIELSDYFDIEDMGIRILYESVQIKQHVSNKTVYKFDIDLNEVLDGKVPFKWADAGVYTYKGVKCEIPDKVVEEDVIFYLRNKWARGFNLFKQLIWKDSLKELCRNKRILEKYLCIQVRCTDYLCDYADLYEEHKQLIHSYPIYLATDNEEVVHYFKSKGLNLFCFTTFPTKMCRNLHYSDVDAHTRFCDVIVDICMATHSEQILSNSTGGFIQLLRDCFANKSIMLSKLQ
jgi:hypothetical protein